ncbi:MAG: response regulator [Methylacidiphilales bacterium]|nr:response regulator [Candidatus Methylacidiphilales bacterium]
MTQKKILLIDDSQLEIQYLTEILNKENYSISVCTDPTLAVEKATEILPDLILLDIIMPQTDGYKTIRKLKSQESTKNIPVIFVSSKNLDFDKFWGKKQGASEYVTKPINQDQLLNAIKKVLIT